MKIFSFSMLALIITTMPNISESLHCYQCLLFDCPSSSNSAYTKFVCDSMISFVQETLSNYYHNVKDMTICPPHTETSQWIDFRKTSPSSQQCPDNNNKDSHCALGRVQVISTLLVSNLLNFPNNVHVDDKFINITSLATVMGCGTKTLAHEMKRYQHDELASNGMLDSCPNWSFSSPKQVSVIEHEQLQISHVMEFEQCDRLTDICRVNFEHVPISDFDYCILPIFSQLKPFGSSNNKDYSSISFLRIAVIGIGVVLLLIMILSFLGIYCDNQ